MSKTGTLQIELLNERQHSETANKIAQLNDIARNGVSGPVSFRQGRNVRYIMTGGVACLPMNLKAAAITTMAVFDKFTSENDPHGEHDCAGFVIPCGKDKKLNFLWKFDYYAMSNGVTDWEHGSEDPSNCEKTMRVLTLMLSEEY